MRYHFLGKTGVEVSELCLGTMTFGNEADEATSIEIMDRALDAGINFFDSADVYNKGVTEEIIGRWLPAHRNEIVMASKVHFPSGPGVNDRRSSRRHIVMETEEILRRLQTDRIDILYLHHWDEDTALEESLAALDTLIQQGKILYAGVSNFAAWQTVQTLTVARERNVAPPVCTQPQYNLLKRQAEVEILPMAEAFGLGVCPYSPIAAGLLTGKYHRGESGRIQKNPMYVERYKNPEYMETAGRFVDYADKHGADPSSMATAWVASHTAVTSAIVGARNMAQFESALGAVSIEMDVAMREEIAALSPSPPLATDREDMSVTKKVTKR